MKETYAYLNSVLKEGDKVVIGLSGGPDSMCLLDILLSINKRITVICAHINHNIREESFSEAMMVEEYCKKRNVIFETTTFDKKSEDSNYSEQELREKRYEYFNKIIKKYNANYLLTAHHGDDLIETILMRMTRGSNLKGYAGFQTEVQKEGYKIIKPLIYTTKEEINDYNQKNNIPFVIDSSNTSSTYTRNRYRKNILPFLKEENKSVHLKYLKFSKELTKYSDYINKIVNKELEKRYKNEKLNIKNFNMLDDLIKTKLIEAVLDKTYIDNLYLVNDKHVNMIIEIINNKRPNIEINLPDDIRIIKSYNELTIVRKKDNITDYKIKLIDNIILPNGHEIKFINKTEKKSNNYLKLNSKKIKLPLYVRTRINGDKMIIKNMNSYKKIKDILIDSKIKKDDRDTLPLVVDSNDEILWIPGIKKSKFDESNEENYDIILWYNYIYRNF